MRAGTRASHSCSSVLSDPGSDDRFLAFVAEVLWDEVVAPVHGLAMTGKEQDENVLRSDLLADVRESAIELGRRYIAVEHGGDVDALIELVAGFLETVRQRLGVRHGEDELQTAVVVVVDTDGEYMQPRRCRGQHSGLMAHRYDDGIGGNQALCVVRHDLDAVVAGAERQCLAHPARQSARVDRERGAVDAPFHLTDAAALVDDAGFDLDRGPTSLTRPPLLHLPAAPQLRLWAPRRWPSPGRGRALRPLPYLAVWVAGELFAYEIGPMQRIIELVDRNKPQDRAPRSSAWRRAPRRRRSPRA